MNAEITRMEGVNKIDSIYFKKPNASSSEKNVEYFVRPDVVIAENGLGAPKYNIKDLLTPASNAESGEPPFPVGISPNGVPSSDIRFSLKYNDNHSPLLAAGSCT